jgi:thiol-disulfide isomerase/thioredoxin
MRTIVPVISLLLACGGQFACGGRSGAGPAERPAPAAPTGDSGSDSGAPAPGEPTEPTDIDLVSLDGAATRFSAHRAPVTVVALWATYCAPCLRELSLIEALHARYRDDGDVTVLLVSVDDMDEDSRATITRLLREKSMTVPALIDPRHQLIDRLAPRDSSGKPYRALPMLVVIDRRFRLRRALDLAHLVDDAAFVGAIAPLVDAARRGEDVPPDEPYEPPLGSGFIGKRTITLTVENLESENIGRYVASLRSQLTAMYPDLHDHQISVLLAEIEARLRAQGSGTFKIDIPPGHTGAH